MPSHRPNPEQYAAMMAAAVAAGQPIPRHHVCTSNMIGSYTNLIYHKKISLSIFAVLHSFVSDTAEYCIYCYVDKIGLISDHILFPYSSLL